MDIQTYLKKDYISKLASQGQRVDGRQFDQRRDIEIIKGYSSEKADGSALVKIGDTQVIAGISMDVGSPYPDRPKSGIMSTSTEFRPMASPDFELGPPRENSIEVARVADRGIRESGCIDMDKLFIEDDKVWVTFIDIHMLDNHGNLFDAAGLAAIAALHDARLPKLEDGKIIRGEWEGKLPVTCTPIPSTFVKINGNILIDPCLDEDAALDSRLTVTTTDDAVHAMQKGGVGSFTVEETEKIVDMAFSEAKKLKSLVEG